jgi:ribonuclease P protein component
VVFKKGRVAACPGARLFFLENGLPHNRVVFTFARNYGNAVERNRARRLGREAYRLLRPRLRGGFDLVLLVYPSETVTFAARQKQLKTLVSKAGLYRPAPV